MKNVLDGIRPGLLVRRDGNQFGYKGQIRRVDSQLRAHGVTNGHKGLGKFCFIGFQESDGLLVVTQLLPKRGNAAVGLIPLFEQRPAIVSDGGFSLNKYIPKWKGLRGRAVWQTEPLEQYFRAMS